MQSTAPGADPECAVTVFEKGGHIVMGQSLLLCVIEKSSRPQLVQSILRADPDIAFAILENRARFIAGVFRFNDEPAGHEAMQIPHRSRPEIAPAIFEQLQNVVV